MFPGDRRPDKAPKKERKQERRPKPAAAAEATSAAPAADGRKRKQKPAPAAVDEATPSQTAAVPAAAPARVPRPGKRNKFKPRRPSSPAAPAAPRAAPPAPPAPAPLTGLAAHRARLAAGAFRHLNETLYTRTGAASAAEFGADPALFAQYHAGFRAAVAAWPARPVDAAVAFVSSLPTGAAVADFGCGDAELAARVEGHARVASLDLVAIAPGVVAADIAGRVPLADASHDAVVLCLALMGTDYPNAFGEAARVLKAGGSLWIAEVRSRFAAGAGAPGAGGASPAPTSKDDVRPFSRAVAALGFAPALVDRASSHFVVLTFTRLPGGPAPVGDVGTWPALRPCAYKRR